MAAIRCTFWKEEDPCGARDNASFREPAVTLPLVTLDRDVTHLLVKVGAGGNKTSASHRVQHFPEYNLILNQAGCCVIKGKELRKMTVCPRHRRKFTRLREMSGACQHPLHKGEKTKLKKPKKVTADISEKTYQETGIVIPIASRKSVVSFCFSSAIEVFVTDLVTDKQYLKVDWRSTCQIYQGYKSH